MDTVHKWDKREKDTFSCTKKDIAEATALYNPDFGKYFFLYTFSFDTSLIDVLTQKDELNNERRISFMSVSLQGPKLKYPIMDKHDYAVYKAVNNFKPYLLMNRCVIFVPHPTARSLLVQWEITGL